MLRLLLVLTTAGCVRISADLPAICGSTSLTFGPAPAGALVTQPFSTDQTLTFGDGLDVSIVQAIRFEGGTIRPTNLDGDLSFLDGITLTLRSPGAGHDLVLLDWHRGAGAVDEIEVPAQAADVRPWLGAEGFTLGLTVSGSDARVVAPVTVDLCASPTVEATLRP